MSHGTWIISYGFTSACSPLEVQAIGASRNRLTGSLSFLSTLMKTLVTGATGFIGQHLVNRLAREGYQVRALVRPVTDPGAFLPDG
ncbi:MAG TPA: NAD-dependent epimerase/dehydratase family protein, partial [Candidatus Eisenbacteria bacterium]|nr:NAD-dependent epimerase/dehydratase family protein [Candidatus Eisenbacteria bacterium]